jgi:tyrosinase
MVYRLRVASPDDPHIAQFRQAMGAAQALDDNRGYNHIAGFHGAPDWYCWHHQANPRTPLQARLFLPWHRAYLLHLEQALQDQVDRVALPWWDWSREQRIPDSYRVANIDGAPNPLHSFRARVPTADPPINRRTRRSPGTHPFARLATATEINALLRETDWGTFSDVLQDYHDNVHGWVGAT